jgi:hypothetical protein
MEVVLIGNGKLAHIPRSLAAAFTLSRQTFCGRNIINERKGDNEKLCRICQETAAAFVNPDVTFSLNKSNL